MGLWRPVIKPVVTSRTPTVWMLDWLMSTFQSRFEVMAKKINLTQPKNGNLAIHLVANNLIDETS